MTSRSNFRHRIPPTVRWPHELKDFPMVVYACPACPAIEATHRLWGHAAQAIFKVKNRDITGRGVGFENSSNLPVHGK